MTMWTIELATNTATADSRIGSHRDVIPITAISGLGVREITALASSSQMGGHYLLENTWQTSTFRTRLGLRHRPRPTAEAAEAVEAADRVLSSPLCSLL